MAGALLLAVLLAYEAVLLLVVPGAARAAPSSPRPPASIGPLSPVRGTLEQAVLLAEDATGGVTVEVDAENTKGRYEVDVVKGKVEIDLSVDVTTGRVVEIGRQPAGSSRLSQIPAPTGEAVRTT